MSPVVKYLSFLIGSLLLTCFLTIAIKKLVLRFSIMDVPGNRSSHDRPMPRGGGIAIYLAFILILIFSRKSFDLYISNILLIGLSIICGIGLIDDIKRVPTKIRFFLQIIAALVPVSFGLKLTAIEFPFLGTLKLGLLAIPATLIWILWLTNLYNFMDGIDGIAAAEAAMVSFFLFLFSTGIGNDYLSYLYLLIMGCSLGFLVYNFPPAKIFMGDVGSYFYGFFFSILAIYSSQGRQPNIPFLVFVLLLGTFIVDSTITLLRRVLKKERWFEAHRSHYYQRLVILGYSHRQVTLATCGMTLVLAFGAIFYINGNDWIRVVVIGCSSLLFLAGIAVIEMKEKQKNKNLKVRA